MRAAFAASLVLSFGLTAGGGTQAFELTSPGYKPGDRVHSEQVFNDLGCTGGNLSPALAWSDPPKGTQSYLLTFYDSRRAQRLGWWHWIVYDFPADATGLPAGVVHGKGLPIGAKEARTDLGLPGYGGPCAPPGETHRYVFTLTALEVRLLDTPADSTAARIGYDARHGNTCAKVWTVQVDANALRLRPVREVPRLRTCSVVHHLSRRGGSDSDRQ